MSRAHVREVGRDVRQWCRFDPVNETEGQEAGWKSQRLPLGSKRSKANGEPLCC